MSEWDEAIARIVDGRVRRVLVLGAVDVGKSTFCQLLLHRASERGRTAAVIDTDVGQKMIGPPATVTGATSEAPEALTGLAFVGTMDPAQGVTRVVSGLDRLCRSARTDLLIVNTSGLLRGVGRRLKAAKIAVLRPDLLLTIGDDPHLDLIAAEHAGVARLRLASSPEAQRKTPGQRRAARREAFRRYLEAGRSCIIPLASSGLLALSDRQLVGLVDHKGRDVALGLVEALDRARGEVQVLSPARTEAVGGLILGWLRLDEYWNARPL
ncbi:Clp1/GlmU family protein [Rubellimicrobium roseum]|uniref:Clp1/GlmU family protein n=1 Tax=Rubellimicrobium roseum TaxID=687525 RepID=UPI00159BD77E|nr:Clp1/GlmU family protein [Rubellimicrobium roseum]